MAGSMKKITSLVTDTKRLSKDDMELIEQSGLGFGDGPWEGYMSPFGLCLTLRRDGRDHVRVIPWGVITFFDYQVQEDNNL